MNDYSEKDLKNFSKKYLWEQLDAVEDERNKLLEMCEALYNHFDSLPMLTEEQESYLNLLAKLIGK